MQGRFPKRGGGLFVANVNSKKHTFNPTAMVNINNREAGFELEAEAETDLVIELTDVTVKLDAEALNAITEPASMEASNV